VFIIGHIGFALLLASLLPHMREDGGLETLLFFSLAPDIDLFVGQPFSFHRTLTHSILLFSLVYLGTVRFDEKFAKSASLGIASHIFLDLLDSGKVTVLYPLDIKFGFGLWEPHDVILHTINYHTLFIEIMLLIAGALVFWMRREANMPLSP